MKNRVKILLIKLREVGDLLLTVPVAGAIKEKNPDNYVAFLVNSGTQDVVTQNPLIDKVFVFDRKTKNLPWYKKGVVQAGLIQQIQKERFDIVFDFTGGDRAAIFSLCSGAKKRVTYFLNSGFFKRKIVYTHLISPPDYPIHEVERNLLLVKPFGYSTKKKSPKIYYSPGDREYIKKECIKNNINQLDIKIHIHPTSKWLFKCWVDSSFAECIDYLSNTYQAKIFLTSGISQKEKDKAKNIYSLCRNKPIDLIGWGTLKQLACLSESCDLFIGIDTGPMHIAAAVKTPVIVLFGPSGPINWAPWGEGHTVVTSDKHDCMPCGKDGCNGTKKSLCLESVTVSMMKKEVDTAIKKIKTSL